MLQFEEMPGHGYCLTVCTFIKQSIQQQTRREVAWLRYYESLESQARRLISEDPLCHVDTMIHPFGRNWLHVFAAMGDVDTVYFICRQSNGSSAILDHRDLSGCT